MKPCDPGLGEAPPGAASSEWLHSGGEVDACRGHYSMCASATMGAAVGTAMGAAAAAATKPSLLGRAQ